MYVRCAYFEGDVDPADRERFDGFMETEIMPLFEGRLSHINHDVTAAPLDD